MNNPPEPIAPKPWFVYLVRAANGALYCGISNDPQRRFAMHQSGKGARFFLSSPAVALVYTEACASKSEALRQERLIKNSRKAPRSVWPGLINLTDQFPSGQWVGRSDFAR